MGVPDESDCFSEGDPCGAAAERTQVGLLSARPTATGLADGVRYFATVAAWCATWDLPLITTASGHFSMDDPNVVEIDLLAHFHP